MYANPKLLDREAHRDLRFTVAQRFDFAAELTAVPLAADEMIAAARHFPVVFSTDTPTMPLALLSLGTRNAFVDTEGRWTAPYVPLHVRRYPFILTSPTQDGHQGVMADLSAPHFQGTDGEPLFLPDGEPGPRLAETVRFLEGFSRNILRTQTMFVPVKVHGVLVEQTAEIRKAGANRRVQGFAAIDRPKLAALDDVTLAGWARSGLLALMYAHLASLDHLQRLADKLDPTQ